MAPAPKTELLLPNTLVPLADVPTPNGLAAPNEGGLGLKPGPCEALDKKVEVAAGVRWELKGEDGVGKKAEDGKERGWGEAKGEVDTACEKGDRTLRPAVVRAAEKEVGAEGPKNCAPVAAATAVSATAGAGVGAGRCSAPPVGGTG